MSPYYLSLIDGIFKTLRMFGLHPTLEAISSMNVMQSTCMVCRWVLTYLPLMTLLRLLMSAHIAAGEGNVFSPCQKSSWRTGYKERNYIHVNFRHTDSFNFLVEIHMILFSYDQNCQLPPDQCTIRLFSPHQTVQVIGIIKSKSGVFAN